MKLLAIETSCDETAAAIIGYDGVSLSVLSSIVSSQAELHAAWGGVIPNLAAREHVRNIIPVVESALHEASVTPQDLDCVAVTQGPGLIPALLIGVSAAKTLALAWDKPLLGVNHLEGHIYANMLTDDSQPTTHKKDLEFPLLALIVSGGHTQLILMHDHFEYKLLGETDDDAAGEAFDKVAKMLNLPYPGGPEIGKRADAYRTAAERVPAKRFPRPMLSSDDYRFSFSGLKTAVLYSLQKESDEKKSNREFVALIAHEFQEAVVDTLVGKTERALQEYQPKTVVIAGGVSANVRLRERMTAMVATYSDCQFLMPPFQYSLDNAAMIGAAGMLRYARMSETERMALRSNATTLEPSAHLPLAVDH
ncbi:MAG: tRNA (adenosine(37)-N6)-threonylcarbamoyltransferase complex transferase subunit TsaD [Candidatus Moraniibacteriota bacterium]|nr:MAG: tRNA (adenosine(37)-N6)-threonylcarbamoyltransferase complex transferase subunit TsaD [Candidatus Moranbacteria bacterium]